MLADPRHPVSSLFSSFLVKLLAWVYFNFMAFIKDHGLFVYPGVIVFLILSIQYYRQKGMSCSMPPSIIGSTWACLWQYGYPVFWHALFSCWSKNPTDWVALTVTAHLMDSMHSCSIPPSLETHGNVSDSMVIQCFGMLYLVDDIKIQRHKNPTDWVTLTVTAHSMDSMQSDV